MEMEMYSLMVGDIGYDEEYGASDLERGRGVAGRQHHKRARKLAWYYLRLPG